MTHQPSLKITRPLAFFDLETTGVNPARDRIVEISVLKILPDGSTEEKTVRVNPGMLIPPGATEVHGITDEDVAGLPGFSHYSESLLAFFDGCDLGGFNAIRFDVPLLVAEFSRAGHSFDLEGRNVVDPMVIFHLYEPRNLTAAYQKYCGKTLEDAHTSTADVRAAAEIFQAQVQLYPDLPKGIAELHEVCHRQNPDWIDDQGRLVLSEQGPLIAFGKYNGRTLDDLAAEDPGYLQWILSNDFSEEVRKLVADALEQVHSDKFETSRGLIPTITDRKEPRGTTGNHDLKLLTSIRELPIGQLITNPLFEKYQRVLTIDDVFAIPDEEFLAIPNFDHEALSILRMEVCGFMDSEDLWDRTMIPVSVPDLSGDSQDYGDSFFQDSFLPYDPANGTNEEKDVYKDDEEDEEADEEDQDDEDDEEADEEDQDDEDDEDISRRLEERGYFIQTTSYDYDGHLGDDEDAS